MRKLVICLIMATMLVSGCSHFNDGRQAKITFAEANDLFTQGSYAASLDKYSEIIDKYPAAADRALFEKGIVYAHPKNEQKDYQKALECFQALIRDYPESAFRQNSEMMIFNIRNVVLKDQTIALKDQTIAAQQAQVETLRRELKGRENEIQGKGNEIVALQKKNEALEQKLSDHALQNASVDRILIEKGARRLTLISKSGAIKTYRIALGGNPIGPKERQGDNKTPEGSYTIDGRNRDSQYHLSLHISYPNERDKKRARELGVSPGGNIMIHGIKNGFSWIGDAHAKVDWTKGCIAVKDEEIEEIAALVPDGTVVEIKP